MAEHDSRGLLCFPVQSGRLHRKAVMPAFSVLRFRRQRKQPQAPSTPPPRPGSPASFYSPGSPDHFSPKPSPIEPKLPYALNDATASMSSLSVREIRKPPELDVDLSFNHSFSVSDLFLAPGAAPVAPPPESRDAVMRDGQDQGGEIVKVRAALRSP